MRNSQPVLEESLAEGARSSFERAWAGLRLAVALLILSAVIQQAITTVSRASEHSWHLPTVTANFFSFFTILSNISAVIALLSAVLFTFITRRTITVEPRWLAVLLASSASYMILTGIVYNVLLRGITLDQGTTVAWANEVLHVVGPVFMLVDVLWAPNRRVLGWGAILGVLVFPVLWIVYTLVRGPLVNGPASGDPWWYPYPFLDPHLQGGYGVVTVYIVGIAAAIALVAFGTVAVGRRRGRGKTH